MREDEQNVTLLIEDPEMKDSFQWTTDRLNFEKRYKPLQTTIVFFSSGDTTTIHTNLIRDEIVTKYLGDEFGAGVALCVHTAGGKVGLMAKHIETDGASRIVSVRKETVKVDDTKSFDEIILTMYSGEEWALNDVWVYDLRGEWINTIGYKQETVRR